MVEHQQALTDHWRNRIDSTQLAERVRRLRTFQKKGRLVEPASVTAGAIGSAPSSEFGTDGFARFPRRSGMPQTMLSSAPRSAAIFPVAS